MYEFSLFEYLLFAIAIWVLVLSFFLFSAVSHYRKLTKGQNVQDLGKILERIISENNLKSQELSRIKEELSEYRNKSYRHLTKSALIRFNPFEDSGGDQSFVIALLDGRNSGLVISSLHSRGGTRVYAKEINQSKALSHKLSKEEKEAVEKAARQV